jgi:hypothetical protein
VRQDTGYRIQDTIYRIQDTIYRIQDTGYRIQDTGYRIRIPRPSGIQDSEPALSRWGRSGECLGADVQDTGFQIHFCILHLESYLGE